MFDGTGIDTEFGQAMVFGSLAVIALFMALTGIRVAIEHWRKRK